MFAYALRQLRQTNPTRAQWAWGAAAVGAALGAVWALTRDSEAPVVTGHPGGEGTGMPLPLPQDEPEGSPGGEPQIPEDEPQDDLPDPGVPPQDPGQLDPGLPPGPGIDVDEDEGPQGGVDLPPGGGQPPDLGPPLGPIMPGVYTPPAPPPSELIYTPAPETLDLLPTSWTKRYTQHIALFDFAQGQHQKLRDWTIRFGLCLTTNATFGELTNMLTGVGQEDVDFGDGDAFTDPLLRFGLRNVDALPIQTAGFQSPLTYKRRYAAKFRRGNPVKITQSLHEINDWATLDACPARQQRWPTPAGQMFWVKRVGGVQMEQWDPAPQVALVVQGAKIVLRISYVGMPYFEVTPGESNAGTPKTPMRLQLKINAKGTNP